MRIQRITLIRELVRFRVHKNGFSGTNNTRTIDSVSASPGGEAEKARVAGGEAGAREGEGTEGVGGDADDLR